MIRIHAADNPTSPARREKGEIPMNARTRRMLAVVTVAALAMLTACGDVSGPDFVVDQGSWSGEWPWFWPEKTRYIADKELFRSVPVTAQGRICLDAGNGEIVITGQPGAASVTVSAELVVGSNVSREDAEGGLDLLGVRVEELPGEILVQTLPPGALNGRRYVVNYTVTVPSDLPVNVSQVNGHVIVEDLESSLLVRLENGSIYGTVSLPPGGEITLWTGNGDLDLRIPTSTSAELSARVDLGTIAWNNLDFRYPVQTSRSFTGTLGNGAGRIDLDTRIGNIDVTGFGG